MNDAMWMAAGTYAFYAFALFALLFVLLYMVFSPWWRTEAGRNIMAVMGALAVIGVYASVLQLTANRPPMYAETRFALFAFLAVSVGWRVVLFIRAQLLSRCRKKGRVHSESVR